jgi:D-alanyl-D-alanine carboxypeptidase
MKRLRLDIKRIGLFVFVLMIPLIVSTDLCAEKGSSHPYHELYQSIVDRNVRMGIPGLILLIHTPEEGTWIGTGGYACLEDCTPIQADSLFHSASVAKFFTAVAVLILKDDGLIDLETEIDCYLSEDITNHIANGHTATVRHLLSHRSGMPQVEGNAEQWNDPWNNWTWQDQLESIYDKPADFSPGEKFDYNNINYVLLAMIMDNLTGDHAQFFRRRMFQTLGMSHTYYKDLIQPPGLVDVYWDRFGNGYLENISSWVHHEVHIRDYGDSGIIASISDYARFVEGVLGGELLSPESLTELTTPTYMDWYCLGGEIRNSPDDSLYGYAHGTQGRGRMGCADVYHFPYSGVTICYATNLSSWTVTPPRDAYEGLWEGITDAVFNLRDQIALDNHSDKKSYIKKKKK